VKWLSAWTPPILWLVLILAATSFPNLDTSNWPNADKVFHLFVYAVWAVLCLRAVRMSGVEGIMVWAMVAAAGLAVGAADELHEKLIPGRTVSLSDFLYNAAGFAAGMFMGYFRFYREKKEPAA
jgi:VanZ family protein